MKKLFFLLLLNITLFSFAQERVNEGLPVVREIKSFTEATGWVKVSGQWKSYKNALFADRYVEFLSPDNFGIFNYYKLYNVEYKDFSYLLLEHNFPIYSWEYPSIRVGLKLENWRNVYLINKSNWNFILRKNDITENEIKVLSYRPSETWSNSHWSLSTETLFNIFNKYAPVDDNVKLVISTYLYEKDNVVRFIIGEYDSADDQSSYPTSPTHIKRKYLKYNEEAYFEAPFELFTKFFDATVVEDN